MSLICSSSSLKYLGFTQWHACLQQMHQGQISLHLRRIHQTSPHLIFWEEYGAFFFYLLILYINISVCPRAKLVPCLCWMNLGAMCTWVSPWLSGHLSHTHRSIWQHAGRERFLWQNPVSLTTSPFGKPNLINWALPQLRQSEEISMEAHLEKAKQQARHIAHCVWTCGPYT